MKSELERLREERQLGPQPHRCLNPDCQMKTYGSGYARCPRCGRDDWSAATVEEMVERLDQIGPPWGNARIPAKLAEGFWIAYEALERLGARP